MDHQPGANQQHHRQGELQRHQTILELPLHKTASLLLRRVLERIPQAEARHQPRRANPEQQPRQRGHQHHERQNRPVQADRSQPWQIFQIEMIQSADAAPGKKDTEQRGDTSQQQALGDELSKHP